jgi:hypothetical protein
MKFPSVLPPTPPSENQEWGRSVMNSSKQLWSLLFVVIGIILSKSVRGNELTCPQ